MASVLPPGLRAMCLAALALAVAVPRPGHAENGDYPEPGYQGWENLRNFEERTLRKAEEAYVAAADKGKGKQAEKLWKHAATQYNLFIEEYPEAAPDVTAYAVYRQGRCWHNYFKYNTARQHYDDVHEFFPNQVPYATAALFFKGLSFKQESADDKAMQAYAQIAKDPQYRKQPLAGYAIVDLAKYTWQNGKKTRAVEYFKDVVEEFRHKNRKAAKEAIDRVIEYYVRHKPDEGALREFFVFAKGFDDRPINSTDEITLEQVATGKYRENYWKNIREKIKRHLRRGFEEIQENDRKRFASRWAQAMEGMNQDWDDYQIDRMMYRYVGDGNRKALEKGLDEQFKRGYKSGDWRRVLHWMDYYDGHAYYDGDAGKYVEYFKLLKLEQMDFDGLKRTLERTRKAPKDRATLLEIVKSKLKLGNYKDNELRWLADFFYNQEDKEYALAVAKKMDSDAEANWTIFGLIVNDTTRELAEIQGYAQKLFKVEDYAGETHWKLAQRLQDEKQYQDAIREYHAAGKGAESGFAAAECQMKSGNLKAAILELQGVEGMFKQAAPDAAYKQADYYHAKGKAELRNQTLKRISLRYKGSRAASRAHTWGETLGLDFVGGEAAE